MLSHFPLLGFRPMQRTKQNEKAMIFNAVTGFIKKSPPWLGLAVPSRNRMVCNVFSELKT